MNIAIVDDNNSDIEQLSPILQDYASLNLTDISIDPYNDPEEFISSYAPFRYTAIFMDIYMNGKNGIDAAGKIREMDPDALIIFLTTSEDHMPSAFSLHAFDYVIKPANKDRIFRLMDDITHQVTRDGKCFTFHDGKSEYRIRFSDIMGIRSNGHYLHITDKDMNEHKSRMNFGDAEEQLREDGRFLLINRGTMVNMDYITDFGNGICVVGGMIHLPYNVKKRKDLEQTYRNYMYAKIRSKIH
ncbi:MAG: response regulator transcription factor [Clostridiales bacterium]|nr:response regulator transcription factor [Clostridiales bacterium]